MSELSKQIGQQISQMSITPARLVAFLNGMLKVDPLAVTALMSLRMPCNDILADHPTIQVADRGKGDLQVGVLGIINGAFGVLDVEGTDYDKYGPITAVYDGSELKKFITTEEMVLMFENRPDAEQSE